MHFKVIVVWSEEISSRGKAKREEIRWLYKSMSVIQRVVVNHGLFICEFRFTKVQFRVVEKQRDHSRGIGIFICANAANRGVRCCSASQF